MALCRVNTVVLLHVLKASEAATTACSNSSLVVSGTRVRSVCVDYNDVTSGKNRWGVAYATHWVYDIDPLGCPTLHELSAYKILGVFSRGTCTFPVPGKFLGLFTYSRVEAPKRWLHRYCSIRSHAYSACGDTRVIKHSSHRSARNMTEF